MTAALSISFFVALMSIVVGVGYWLSLREPARAAAGSEGAEAEAESPNALPEDAPLWIESLHQVGAAYPYAYVTSQRAEGKNGRQIQPQHHESDSRKNRQSEP